MNLPVCPGTRSRHSSPACPLNPNPSPPEYRGRRELIQFNKPVSRNCTDRNKTSLFDYTAVPLVGPALMEYAEVIFRSFLIDFRMMQ